MHLLLVNPTWPRFDRDSGSFRLFEIIKILRAAGHEVTFAPKDVSGDEPYRTALTELGVAILELPSSGTGDRRAARTSRVALQQFLRTNEVDVAILYHHRTAHRMTGRIRAASPRTMVVVDCVDLHFLRMRRHAEMSGNATALAEAAREEERELATYRNADLVAAISEEEAQVLRGLVPQTPVITISNVHPLPTHVPPFDKRKDLFFVGSFDHPPNVDAVEVMAIEFLPRLHEHLPDVRLRVAGGGKHMPQIEAPGLELLGFVDRLEPLIDSSRLMVAPLRFGAGAKGKVGQALAHGLPVATTTIGAEGLGLTPMLDVLLADDMTELAALVARAYRDPALWSTLSIGGRARIEATFSPARVAEQLEHGVLCSPVLERTRARRRSLLSRVFTR
ncbi:MAG: glycosyltransferase family 4 protein [Planctomycetota bacterium]|nr:glycosyltransferase family 4 protein [Planctomycetota bacterium]